MTYLLDTNVVSETRRPDANAFVRTWFRQNRREDMYVSVLVLGEIRKGIESVSRRDKTQAAVLENWFNVFRAELAGHILLVTEPIAEQWGQLQANRTLPIIDGLLAATALVHDLTVVTRNVRDFVGTGVTLLNPFEPSA